MAKGRFLLPVPKHIPSQTWEIVGKMKKDEVSRSVLNDTLAMKFAHKLSMKHYHDQDRHEHVRCKLRELGRLMLQLKNSFPSQIPSLAAALEPAQFQTLVECVRQVSGFNLETNNFATPSLALKLGHSLKKCAMILLSEALQTMSKDQEDKAKAFIRLCEMEWSSEVSTAALGTLHSQKLNRMTVLPLTEDIVKLHDCLTKSSAESLEVLQSACSTESAAKSWLMLAQSVLAQLILFNRRRVGKVSKMTLDDFS